MKSLTPRQQEEIVRQATEWLGARADVRLAIVYGSFSGDPSANHRPSDQSDVDVAVALDAPATIDQRADLAQGLSQAVSREVDLIDLRSATGTVLREALTRGRIVKRGDPMILASILKRMWLDYEDFGKSRDALLAARRKKVFGA